jgi:hypothetical protein
MDFDYVF